MVHIPVVLEGTQLVLLAQRLEQPRLVVTLDEYTVMWLKMVFIPNAARAARRVKVTERIVRCVMFPERTILRCVRCDEKIEPTVFFAKGLWLRYVQDRRLKISTGALTMSKAKRGNACSRETADHTCVTTKPI